MQLISKLLGAFFDTRTIRGGSAAGLKLVSARADPSFSRGTYERPIQEAIAAILKPGDVFYDIGANIGFFSLIAARSVGPQGRVYAFEPVADNAASIVRTAQLNKMNTIEVFAEAVGARNGRAQLYLARHVGGASLATAGKPPDMNGIIEIDITTLDMAVSARNLRPPALVKIDVEGAELDVFRGMVETIQNYHPAVIYEIDDASSEGLRLKAAQLADFMKAAGYRITVLPPSYPGAAWNVEHVLAQK